MAEGVLRVGRWLGHRRTSAGAVSTGATGRDGVRRIVGVSVSGMQGTARQARPRAKSIERACARRGFVMRGDPGRRSAPRCQGPRASAAALALLSRFATFATTTTTTMIAMVTFVATAASAAEYEIQAEQSRIRFEVAHSDYIKPVRGRFGSLSGAIGYDAKAPEATTGEVVIDAASVDTDNGFRDEHLRTSFFEADRFPEIHFRLGRLRLQDGEADGTLTMHGVTRPVVLAVSNLREVEGPSGLRILRARVSTRLNRRDFGVEENTARSEGLGRIMEHIQQGLDELIEDEVVVRVSIVAHAVAKPGSPAALASVN